MLSPEERVAFLLELERSQKFRKADYFVAYPKQMEFFKQGLKHRERLFFAGNQLGKTYAGAFETKCHLTGEYPKWWPGRKFTRPIQMWAAGESSTLVRDAQQALLCGDPNDEEAFGTGLIPKESFVGKPTLARGVTNAYDSIVIQHKTNGVVDGNSVLTFKSYEQGRSKFQAKTLDAWWADEEPPADVYSELLARITATKGFGFMTFTPLLGMSTVVKRFRKEFSPDRAWVQMGIKDALHITPEDRERIIMAYPAHEREARANGEPMLGSGRIFLTAEAALAEPAIEFMQVPLHWKKLWAIDFGIDHPFAAVLLAWDVDADVIHVLHVIKMPDALPMQHARPMKQVAGRVPVAWPQDGTAREKGSGHPLHTLYKREGLLMLPDHVTWEEGGYSTEAAIMEIDDREKTGKIKYAAHLSDLWEERREYHRKDGKIVKENDDVMSALQKGIMGKRFARPVPLGSVMMQKKAAQQTVARDVDFDPF